MNQPVHLKATGPRNDRQAMWEAIRRIGKEDYFSAPDIRGALRGSTPLDKIRAYMKCLEAGGYITRIYDGAPPYVYSLERDAGIEAPRVRKDGSHVTQGLKREQMWRGMRVLKTFDAHDLIQSATESIQLNDAKGYIGHLHKAGYLALIAKANPSGGLARYSLLPTKYTGPKPPMVQRIKQVFDPNLGKVVWSQGGAS